MSKIYTVTVVKSMLEEIERDYNVVFVAYKLE